MERLRLGLELHKKPIEHTIITHPPITSLDEAERILGVPRASIVKTLIFKRYEGWSETWFAVAALRGTDRVDSRKLAQAVHTTRKELSLVSPEQVEEITGIPAQYATPFGHGDRFRVVFDKELMAAKTVFCSTGEPTSTLIIPAGELLRLSRGRVASIREQGDELFRNRQFRG